MTLLVLLAPSVATYVTDQLRAMCNCGATDYTVNGVDYWTDTQLQTILNQYSVDTYQKELIPMDELLGGVYNYIHYSLGNTFIESATFALYDSNYIAVTTGFSVDYTLGLVTFTASTNGMPYYASFRSYDINRAASEVWRMKAAHFAQKVNMKAGNQSINLSDQMAQALQMAAYYSQQAGARSISFERDDTC